MLFSNDPIKALQRAVDSAVAYAETVKRDERDSLRKILESGIDRLKMVEVLADDRKPSDTPRLDSANVRVNSEPPIRANLKNPLRDLILGRS
jgi:hypothetical protein